MILLAITRAGLTPGRDAAWLSTVASSHFFHDGMYHLENQKLSAQQMSDFLLAGPAPIRS